MEESQIILRPISGLFKDSLKLYAKTLIRTLPVICAATILLFINLVVAPYKSTSDPLYMIGIIAGVVAVFSELFIFPVAVFSLAGGRAYRDSVNSFVPYFLIFIFGSIVTIGGFVLLVIPGIIFLTWFWFLNYVNLLERKNGLSALHRSRELVRDNFWKVLLRFAAAFLAIFIVAVFFIFVVKYITAHLLAKSLESFYQRVFTEVVTRLFGFLIAPFFVSYGYLVYLDLVAIKAAVPETQPTRKEKISYSLVALLGAPILGLLLVLNTLYLIARDAPPPNDSDVVLQKIEVPENENAYFSLQKIIEKLPQEQKEKYGHWQEMVDGKAWYDDEARALSEGNQKFFEYFTEAAEKSQYIYPPLADPANITPALVLPSLNSYRIAARVVSIKSEYLFRYKKEKEAFDSALEIVRLGRLITEGRGTLIEYLVGIAIENTGLDRIRSFTERTTLPKTDLIAYRQELEGLLSTGEGLRNAFRGEYMSFKNISSTLLEGVLSNDEWGGGQDVTDLALSAIQDQNFYFQPNRTMQFYLEMARNQIQSVNDQCDISPVLADEEVIKSQMPHSIFQIIFTENSAGRIIVNITAASLSGAIRKHCALNFAIVSDELLLALRAYKLEHNSLPAQLSDLVPDYIAKLPSDPMTGEELLYSQTEKVLYSKAKDRAIFKENKLNEKLEVKINF